MSSHHALYWVRESIPSNLSKAAVKYAGAEIITLAVRRTNSKDNENILDYIPKGVTLLPNTSGARNADEAVRIARLARELGCGDFVKVEIMRDTKYLLPDNQETVKATEILAKEGFVVMPYMYPDLNTARDLVNAGAASVMPLASPIGSNKGLATKDFIQILIDEIDLPIIVDAGIGQTFTGLRGYGNGGGCGYVQYSPCNSRRPPSNGRGFQTGSRGRQKGLFSRSWTSSHPWRISVRYAYRISQRLR